MVRTPTRENLTPADELRGILSDCERALGQIRGAGPAAIDLLHGLDRATALLPQLARTGVDLRPEQTRLATLESQLRAKAGTLVRELRAGGGLALARRTVQPDRRLWWWYLDEEVRRGRFRSLRRLSLSLAVGLALVAVGLTLCQRFWAPDPVTMRVSGLEFEGERLASEGQYASSLALFQEAQTLRPEAAGIMVWRAVLTQMTGRDAEAADLFAAAQLLYGDGPDFQLARGQVYVRLQQLDRALSDATMALQNDPESPSGHFLLGVVHEARGDLSEALAAFEQASLLAEAQGQAELTAVVRVRMAFLLQQGGIPGGPGARR